MSCTLAAGQSLRWLRDTCCAGEVAEAAKQGVDPYELMTALAEKTPIGADGLLFLPYLMGERSPLLDEKARGAFIGLSGGHGRGHLIRAVLEGVTYSQRQCVDVLRGMNVPTEEMMACGGGARSAFWRQMLADVYGCPIQTAKAALEGRPIPPLPDLAARCDTAVRQFELAAQAKGERVAVLEARRHYCWYLKGVPHSGYYKEQIVQMNTLEDVYRVTRGIKRDLV